MKNVKVTSILFLFCFISQGQITKIDSLKKFITTSKDNWEVTNKCMTLSELLMTTDTLEANKYLYKGLKIAKKRNDNINIGQYYLLKSTMVRNKSDFEKAFKYSDSSIYYFTIGIKQQKNKIEKEKNLLSIATSYSDKASALSSIGKSEEAIKIYHQAIKEWGKTNLPEKYQAIAVITSNIGGIYLNLGNNEKVLEYDKLGLSYIKKSKSSNKNRLESDIAYLYIYISDDYIRLKNNKLASIYIDSTKTLVEKLNQPHLWSRYLGGKAIILSKNGQHQEALKYYKKALVYAETIGNKETIASIKKNIGDILIKLNKLAEGRIFLDQAYKLSETINKYGNKEKYYQSFIKLESKSGNYKRALEYSELLRNLKDSLSIKDISAKVNEINIKYQTEKKELEIKTLTQQNELQNLIIKRRLWISIALALGIIGIGGIAYSQFKNYKTKKALLLAEQDKAIAEERLRIATDMHDDVGTGLSRIRYITNAVKTGETSKEEGLSKVTEISDDTITKMSEIIWALNESNQTLEELIYFIRSQASEMVENAKLNFEGILPEVIPNLSFGWMRNRNTYLLAKETINNAIKHAQAKTIRIQFEINDQLIITIKDDGIGFDTNKKFNGNRLNNYKKRIEKLGGKHSIISSKNEGTTIVYQIPLV